MSLRDMQRDFRLWLLSGSPDAAARLPGAHGAGLAVYQNNYRAQLVGCLRASYPLLHARMGEAAFLQAAVRHINTHPPHDWTLDAYALEFGATLASLFPDNPDLHELAWIELALGAAFVALDAAPVTPALLATLDWEHALLTLAPSLRIAPAATNAAAVWQALSDGEPAPEAEMLAEPGMLVVWRSGYLSCLRATDAIEGAALAALGDEGSFAAMCALLAERLGEDAGIARAGALLADWIGAGLITGAASGPSKQGPMP
jgi:hypothetical protein